MAPTVVFPDIHASLNFEGEYFTFPAIVNGKSVKVRMTPEALQRRFGAKSSARQDLEYAITRAMPGIHALARSMIESSHVSPAGEVVIDGKDVMNVTFGDTLRRSSYDELLALQATQRLEEAIGPPAPRVSATWDLDEDERGRAAITLELADATESAKARFEPSELARDSNRTRLRFIRLWGDVLQEKSHRLLQKLLAS